MLCYKWGTILGIAVLLSSTVIYAGQAITEAQFTIPEGLPKLRAPIVVTTCGQSPGAMMVKLICDRLGLPCEQRDLLTVQELEALCASENPPRVLFITTGTSLKGMGAAGVDVDKEVARCLALVKRARELGLFIIVGQIEGPSRRTDEYDEKSIRAITPEADLLITRADVNWDGYFTAVSQEKGIPQIFINQTLDLLTLFPLIFNGEGG
ncbi:MAG: DUF6305 family protein [Candidatus Hadarchaeum sp.]